MFGNPLYLQETPDLDLVDPQAKRPVSNVYVPDSFDLKKNKKKYCLHQVEFPGTWQVDLMFSKNNCFLLAIEVNTRYLYAERTNIYVTEYNERAKKWEVKEAKKSAVALARAIFSLFRKGWNPTLIVSDSESALKSDDISKWIYKPYKIKHRTVPLIPDEFGKSTSNHTSLAIIDRVTRTLRRWVYDRGWSTNIIPKMEVEKFVERYNNRPHSTFKKIFEHDITPYEVHNDLRKEMYVIKHILTENAKIRKKHPDIVIPKGTKVKVYNQPNAFGKRTRISRPVPYEVVSNYSNIYNVKNTVTGEIMTVPRIWLEIL